MNIVALQLPEESVSNHILIRTLEAEGQMNDDRKITDQSGFVWSVADIMRGKLKPSDLPPSCPSFMTRVLAVDI
ncbi:MAG TPA: hypothetical protein PLL33_01330, partial [Paracoccus sp. (in: a-proteobacteria)]|nr:hypothetical protein [Paracoccus sp. (in: a-proteobacteria)]